MNIPSNMNKVVKISVGSKKLDKYRKTHNLYIYNDKKGKPYYKAVPKRITKVNKPINVRKRKNLIFWPALAVLALILAIVAKSTNPLSTGAVVDPIEIPSYTPIEAIEEKEEPNLPEITNTQVKQPNNQEIKQNTSATSNSSKYPAQCAQYYGIVAQYDWDVDIAMAVMQAESGCNPDAVGYNKKADGTVWSSDRGLMQVNDYYHNTEGWNNPATNIAMAYKIYSSAGKSFSPWSTYTSGKYLKFM